MKGEAAFICQSSVGKSERVLKGKLLGNNMSALPAILQKQHNDGSELAYFYAKCRALSTDTEFRLLSSMIAAETRTINQENRYGTRVNNIIIIAVFHKINCLILIHPQFNFTYFCSECLDVFFFINLLRVFVLP